MIIYDENSSVIFSYFFTFFLFFRVFWIILQSGILKNQICLQVLFKVFQPLYNTLWSTVERLISSFEAILLHFPSKPATKCPSRRPHTISLEKIWGYFSWNSWKKLYCLGWIMQKQHNFWLSTPFCLLIWYEGTVSKPNIWEKVLYKLHLEERGPFKLMILVSKLNGNISI